MESKIEVGTAMVYRNGFVHFYQVTEVSKSFVTVRHIASKTVKQYDSNWRSDVVPDYNNFLDDETYKRKVNKYGFIKLSAGYFLHVWEGKPVYCDNLN